MLERRRSLATPVCVQSLLIMEPMMQPLSLISPSLANRPSLTSAAPPEGAFDEALARARQSSTTDLRPEADDAQRSAEEFVGLTLVLPLLKQMRESAEAPPPWGPSQAEKQMQAMADVHTATAIARGSNLPIVDRIARDLRARQERQP